MRRITINVALIGLLIALTTATAQAPEPGYYIDTYGVTFWGVPNAHGQITGMAQLRNDPQSGGALILMAPIPGDPGATQSTVLTGDVFLIGGGIGQTTNVPYLRPDGSTGTLVYKMGVMTGVQ